MPTNRSSAAVARSKGSLAVFFSALLLATPAVAGDDSKACSGPTCSGACATEVDTAAQERLAELVTHQRDELVNLTRTLALEQRRQSELEARLATANSAPRVAPVVPQAATSALEEENRRLRQQLEIQGDENEKLVAKLRTAQRVTDLVFRNSANAGESADVRDSANAADSDASAAIAADKPAADDHVPAGWTWADAQE